MSFAGRLETLELSALLPTLGTSNPGDPDLVEGANLVTGNVGNDPPVIESVEVPSEIVSGIVLVQFLVSDSSCGRGG